MTGQKSVLISGCSAYGISTALAQELTRRDNLVLVAVPDTSKISSDISALAAVQVVELDPESPASVSEAAKTVSAATEGRGLDVLINDAGVGHSLALLDVMVDSTRDVYDAKVSETLSMAGAFADLLAKKQGRVMNLSSSGAFITAPCMNKATHFSSKGALTGLSDQLRSGLAPLGIDVKSVMLETIPSATDSEPRVLFPDKSSYASVKEAVTRWALGSPRSDEGTIGSLVDLVLEDNAKGQAWQWMSSYTRGTGADDASAIEKGIARPVAA